MTQRLAILGSTGSIGRNALAVAEHLGDSHRVAAISGHANGDLLVEQATRHRPDAVAVTDGATAERIGPALRRLGATVYAGADGLVKLAGRGDVDLVLSAVVGAAGLPAALATVRAGKTLALANKEALVVAGGLLMPLARRTGAAVLPVDSEHSAIFQALLAGRASEVSRVILTASGGPFRGRSREDVEHATPADALKHPTWSMGAKITVDSATMFNKALELIEACHLFGLPPEKVDVVVHPESVVHGMVEFADGSTLAQLGEPDMRTPIQYALTYPHRRPGCSTPTDWTAARSLTFEPPDEEAFPALRLGRRVASMPGTTAGATMNAANEEAVAAFLAGRVRFGVIWRVVEGTMDECPPRSAGTLEELLTADAEARECARRRLAPHRSATHEGPTPA